MVAKMMKIIKTKQETENKTITNTRNRLTDNELTITTHSNRVRKNDNHTQRRKIRTENKYIFFEITSSQ
jgi:hypothetical protein